MILYNVTVNVAATIAAGWEQWLLQEGAPDMLATGCFNRYVLVRLLAAGDDDSITYAVQYFAPDLQQYLYFIKMFAAPLQKKSTAKWGQKCISFSTAMEVLHQSA